MAIEYSSTKISFLGLAVCVILVLAARSEAADRLLRVERLETAFRDSILDPTVSKAKGEGAMEEPSCEEGGERGEAGGCRHRLVAEAAFLDYADPSHSENDKHKLPGPN